MTDDVWWYYMLELGFYVSLILSLFMDVKRKVRSFNFRHFWPTVFGRAFGTGCRLSVCL